MMQKDLEASTSVEHHNSHQQHYADEAFGLEWHEVKYEAPRRSGGKGRLTSLFSRSSRAAQTSKTEKALLLDGISGRVSPGQMVAIMGPSGAGKSTLLDVLSNRKSPTSGSINIVGGEDDSHQAMKTISSYVEQEDALLGVLTVRETIFYSAKLSLPSSTTTLKQLNERVDTIIADLGLSQVQNQRIGTPIQRGISGGQKRRVTIGCSLVTLPKILFLDEPTSGLDTATAFEVIKAIRSLAVKHGITVLATIHSPNWEIFQCFDKTLLLAKGKTIFEGKVDQVAPYFANLGHECPKHTNPADHMITLVNDDFLTNPSAASPVAAPLILGGDAQGLSSVPISGPGQGIRIGDTKAFADAWVNRPITLPSEHSANTAASGQYPQAQSKESAPSSVHANSGETVPPHLISPTKVPTESNLRRAWSQTVTLTKRNFINYSRNLLAYGVRLGMYIGMGVLMATVWVNLAKTDTKINDRLSVHFFSVAFLGFMAVAGIPAFLEERGVMKRETKNNLYGPLPFTLANTISTIPLMFLCSVFFTVICYFSIGLSTQGGAGVFFRFLAYLYLGVLAAEFQALLVAAIIPIFVAALAVAAFLNGFWMCVQGFFIRAVNLPRFWYYWAHWIDYETYAFNILVKNDFKGLIFTCQGSIAQNTCLCSYPSSLIKDGICAVSGEDVLQALDINGISTTLYALILLIIAIVYRILFYLVLKIQM